MSFNDINNGENKEGIPSDARIEALSAACGFLSDATRLRIIDILFREERINVSHLSNTLRMSQPAVSHHLTILRYAGFVDFRREGKSNFYFLEQKCRKIWESILLGVAGEEAILSPGNQTSTPLHVRDFLKTPVPLPVTKAAKHQPLPSASPQTGAVPTRVLEPEPVRTVTERSEKFEAPMMQIELDPRSVPLANGPLLAFMKERLTPKDLIDFAQCIDLADDGELHSLGYATFAKLIMKLCRFPNMIEASPLSRLILIKPESRTAEQQALYETLATQHLRFNIPVYS
jgi:DNA-binding transcriptional ArsR family regulator